MIIQSSFSEVPPLSDRRVRSMFWDPQNPAALLLPRVENDQFVMERFFADPGIGCNEHELSALIKIVTAHEEYMNIKRNLSYDSSIQPEILLQGHLRDLSTKYRSAVRDCLSDWEMGIEEQLIKSSAQMNDIDDTKKNLDNDYENIQLLQIVYSIMHISDIFLPLLPSANSWDYQVDPYQRPGIATAATVRYLRYHHLDIPEEMLNDSDPDEITEMMNSAHPEQFKKGSVYWEYVRQLVLRGALEKAWNVLSKHSIFVIASSICKDSEGYGRNPTEFAEMTEIYQGFSKLKEIMLRAPLPGGRNENYDDALVSEDCSEDVIEEAFLFMDGLDIVPSDYKFWETAYSTVSNGATTIEHSAVFNEKLAIQKHRQWSEYVKDIRPYFALSKRLRAVDSILAILSGDFSGVNFDTWAQQVCAELLYRHPDSRPAQISKRTRRIVDQFLRDNENSAHINTVVNIMEGDAGNAIELIYASGGAAGAALPATLMSLLYNLFVESSILPEDLAFRRVEFLCEASSALVSSLAESNPDIGSQLAVRLLVPYAVQERNDELVATISNVLEYYNPSSDQYAETLISHLTPLFELESIQTVDSCVRILLYLYGRHKMNLNMSSAVKVILKGIELEAAILPSMEVGLCYKTLAADCHKNTLHLLESLVGVSPIDPTTAVRAKNMVLGFDQFNADISKMPLAAELQRAMYIVEHYGKDGHERLVANSIVACLERRGNSNGVYLTASPVSSHYYLLQLACQLIEHFGKESLTTSDSLHVSPFDKKDITTLMERLNQLGGSGLFPTSELCAMEQILALGLGQSFVSEKAMRKQREVLKASTRVDIKSVCSSRLIDYELSIQEQVVRNMLQY